MVNPIPSQLARRISLRQLQVFEAVKSGGSIPIKSSINQES